VPIKAAKKPTTITLVGDPTIKHNPETIIEVSELGKKYRIIPLKRPLKALVPIPINLFSQRIVNDSVITINNIESSL
jgi:hypothetical protein